MRFFVNDFWAPYDSQSGVLLDTVNSFYSIGRKMLTFATVLKKKLIGLSTPAYHILEFCEDL